MPNLSLEVYRGQVEASNGHTHGGLEGHGAEKESKSGAAHSHDKKPHSHKHGDKH
jgi:hypothetical protein